MKNTILIINNMDEVGVNIMQDEELIQLVEKGEENEKVDFKEKVYTKDTDFIKDIVAFANSDYDGDRCIIFGVEDSQKSVVGIGKNDLKEVSSIDQIINTNIEPFIKVEQRYFYYKEKLLGCYIISNTDNRPYIIKKTIGQGKDTIQQGSMFIRKNATNCRFTRWDLDKIYSYKESPDTTIKKHSEKPKVSIRKEGYQQQDIQIYWLDTKQMYRVKLILENVTSYSIESIRMTNIVMHSYGYKYSAKLDGVEKEGEYNPTRSLANGEITHFSVDLSGTIDNDYNEEIKSLSPARSNDENFMISLLRDRYFIIEVEFLIRNMFGLEYIEKAKFTVSRNCEDTEYFDLYNCRTQFLV